MILNDSIESQIVINKNPLEVWDALVNPAKIKKYLFGTNAVSKWMQGSELIFEGVYEGTPYKDKGIIKEIIPNQKLQYTYLSSFSSLPDLPENYSLISFEIIILKEKTVLKFSQQGFVNLQNKVHSEKNWAYILKTIKELVESG